MSNIMDSPASNLNQQIAERVRELRSEQGLSLDALANKSGVSRSMISLIERGESSPTAVVLEKLAAGLDVTLPALFDAAAAAKASQGPLVRRDQQQQWRDPESGYIRRNVSPPGMRQSMQIAEIHFPPGARVTFETGGRDINVYQQVWVLEGTIDISLGVERYHLREGDCLAMHLDRPIMFNNPTRRTTRYAIVIASEPYGRR
jgi:transcriptional regulator with XRE-family HTH domain